MHIFVNLYPVIAIISAVCALQKNRTFINTHFQSRKVHENLVGTQPAREVFTRFFSSYARHFTYAWRFALARLRHRGAMCALNRVRKCACRAAPKKSRFKASQLPLGCLRCRRFLRALLATIFRIRERLRIACALSLLTVFKFVAIMRQSAANGKRNTAMRAARSRSARSLMCAAHARRTFAACSPRVCEVSRDVGGDALGDVADTWRRGVRRCRRRVSAICRRSLGEVAASME